jgi:hypothetical protein
MNGMGMASRGFHDGGGICLATSGRVCPAVIRGLILYACNRVSGYLQRRIRIKGYTQRCR